MILFSPSYDALKKSEPLGIPVPLPQNISNSQNIGFILHDYYVQNKRVMQ